LPLAGKAATGASSSAPPPPSPPPARRRWRRHTRPPTHKTQGQTQNTKEEQWKREQALDDKAEGSATKILTSLSNEEVILLLATLNIHGCDEGCDSFYIQNNEKTKYFIHFSFFSFTGIRTSNIDGKTLDMIDDWRKVQTLMFPSHTFPNDASQELYARILEFKSKGVPLTFLKELSVIYILCNEIIT
jgi:hypothetical protein